MFAASMRRLREEFELTQTDVAKAMSKQGFSFHQPTVQRIESGERPIRLDEARAIAEILHSDVGVMVTGIGQAQALNLANELTRAREALKDAMRKRRNVSIELALAMDEAENEGGIDDRLATRARELLSETVADVLDEAQREDRQRNDLHRELNAELGESLIHWYDAGGKWTSLLRETDTATADGEHPATP